MSIWCKQYIISCPQMLSLLKLKSNKNNKKFISNIFDVQYLGDKSSWITMNNEMHHFWRLVCVMSHHVEDYNYIDKEPCNQIYLDYFIQELIKAHCDRQLEAQPFCFSCITNTFVWLKDIPSPQSKPAGRGKEKGREFSIQGEGDGTACAVVNQLWA
jgi:hypothetical protein